MVNTQSRTKKGCQIHFYFYLTRRSFSISSNSSKTVKQFEVRKCCSGVCLRRSPVYPISAPTSWFGDWDSKIPLLIQKFLSWRCIYHTMCFVLQSFEITSFCRFKESFSFPSSWPRNNHPAPPNSCQDVCIGAQDSLLLLVVVVVIAKILLTLMIKCLYQEISRREYGFLSSR